jgi:hypothetical protein
MRVLTVSKGCDAAEANTPPTMPDTIIALLVEYSWGAFRMDLKSGGKVWKRWGGSGVFSSKFPRAVAQPRVPPLTAGPATARRGAGRGPATCAAARGFLPPPRRVLCGAETTGPQGPSEDQDEEPSSCRPLILGPKPMPCAACGRQARARTLARSMSYSTGHSPR